MPNYLELIYVKCSKKDTISCFSDIISTDTWFSEVQTATFYDLRQMKMKLNWRDNPAAGSE